MAIAGSNRLPVFSTPKQRTRSLRIAATTICLGFRRPASPGANRQRPVERSPRSAIHARHFASLIGRLSRELQMESYPKSHNEVGAPIVRIGCRELKCIGDKPPQDHPHIYLNMGDASEIVCPYCSTLFRFDPSMGAHEADPADCACGDID